VIQNKLLNIILIILIALSLLAIAGALIYMLVFDGKTSTEALEQKGLSGAEVQELSITTEKITTNLADRRMIILSLSFLADNKKSKEELEQRMVQLKDIIITTLHSQTREDFETTEGLEAYKLLILQKINEIMEQGKIIDVFYVDKVIQ
jgi:flagellar FliL protein